jgi:sugar phosphate isomerase/epimerase
VYCLNIHPGESWAEQLDAICTHALAVRARVAPGRPFGLGLRLSAASAESLSSLDEIPKFAACLRDQNLNVPTINAFPFGSFHRTRVKEEVYRPDWRTDARVEFTLRCADILIALRPPRAWGSISTVPVGYAADFKSRADVCCAMDKLITTARALAEREARSGVRVSVALEPEPSCALETCQQTIEFFDHLRDRAGADAPLVERHIGVCLDTCHAALAFEAPSDTWAAVERAGIAVAKIQISAALEVRGAPPPELAAFVEPVYLHQVRGRTARGARYAWNDLPDALADWPPDADMTRIHFHVPLFWRGDHQLTSTRSTLDASFWARARAGACPLLEIETYSFDVLPPPLRARSVVDSIAREFEWVFERLGRT